MGLFCAPPPKAHMYLWKQTYAVLQVFLEPAFEMGQQTGAKIMQN